ncbi:8233_t:CDS:2 [Diversispora eburnea]|uniref:8233_t:CDS:1 n=1 Tax=Diversispora eburnea TaxID=1213867 RepID=A0A9N8WLT9_9GLOM|nr:8233_t:CDS:2 [Diversispora eburnea]
MDYNAMLKTLAKEAGISIPSNAFEKPNAIRTSTSSGGGSTVNSKSGGGGNTNSGYSEGIMALKFLDNSEQLNRDFLDELQAHHRCSLGSGIIDCYGVSKDPETNRYVMVMRYAEQGDLRRYLSQFFAELSWDEKIEVFDKIVKGLQGIHDAGLVHRDFHSVSYKWRYLADGKAPFQGPKLKKVKTGCVSNGMTVDRSPIDRSAIDKIRAERRKLEVSGKSHKE